MGVNLWDRERVWTVGNAKPPPRREAVGNNFYRSTQRRAGRYDENAALSGGGRQQPREPWNEWGHDYSRSKGDEGDMDGATLLQVNTLLKRRLTAKMERDFETADQLLDELKASFRVQVNDGYKEWRSDGQPFLRYHKRVGRMDAGVDEKAVMALITERQEARKVRDYPTADDILNQLLDKHGVVLDDAAWSWRVVGGSHDGRYGEGGGYGRRRSEQRARDGQHDYERDPEDSVETSAADLKEIDDLLSRRMHRKMAREFRAADALQDELRREFGVEVDDKFKSWRVAYPFEPEDEDDGY